MNVDEKTAPLELGTPEAAVRSCVSLMASVMGQREELLAYWLDLYYQVRAVYERENAAEPDPTVLRRGDLYPVLRELMQDALKSAVRGEAAARMERKKAGKTEPSTPLSFAQDDREDSGPPRASAPTGDEETRDADAESAPP